jgi:ribosomal protein S18 acetylase RimI-like enzyme
MIMRETITFRPETDDDLDFLFRLYASTREEELRPVPWSDEQKAIFLRQQFEAQRTHYRGNYDNAEFLLILEHGTPIGRLYLHARHDDMRVMDISLMTEHRGRGIGGLLMKELIEENGAAGRAVSIHVEQFNPAIRLYERLGFVPIESYGPYHLMKWNPGAVAAEASPD